MKIISDALDESFKQEAVASWIAYQETGLHLTIQELREWLNTWGTDKEAEIPAVTGNYYADVGY